MHDFSVANQYGPLPPGLKLRFADGYNVLVGANNVGKSALLQFVAAACIDDGEIGSDRVAYVSPDRHNILATLESGGRTLATFNSELASRIRGGPASFTGGTSPNPNELWRLLLTHRDLIGQVERVKGTLEALGFRAPVIGSGQHLRFDEVGVDVQGSGLRAVLSIAAALSLPDLKVLLIDEPEISLEPRLQRVLMERLVQWSKDDEQRLTVVATHSQLFLPRKEPRRVVRVERDDGGLVNFRPLTSQREVLDVTFGLLGNSVEDLFLPRNYLLVEGASDQVIAERILELRFGSEASAVKVLAAGGVSRVARLHGAVSDLARPLVVGDSPYADRVVALIDQPYNGATEGEREELSRQLGDRLIVLPAPSLEEYLPAELFTKAEMTKESVLSAMEGAKGNYREMCKIKRECSSAIAPVMRDSDLTRVSELVDLVDRAMLVRRDQPGPVTSTVAGPSG